MEINKCPITGSSDRITFVNLGEVPLVNNLCNTREESLNVKKYPLAVQVFMDSKLSCITELIDKEKLFLNYVYQSGVNKPYLDHCRGMFNYLCEQLSPMIFDDHNLIVDIGGNDGSLLKVFREMSGKPLYVNVDASHTFREMNEAAGITYINKFFDQDFKLFNRNFPMGQHPRADMIVSTNVFQHNWDIRGFVRGIYNNLSEEGVWCLEFPYLLTTLLNDNYDQIYHEHIYYYLLCNIRDLLSQEGLRIVNVSFHEIHSGTLRVLSVKQNSCRVADHSVNSFLALESMLTKEYYVLWGKRTIEKIVRFREYIEGLYFEGWKIACFGAAAKGCVFLNTCHLNYEMIEFIVDDTPFKQGKYVPGTGLEIVNRDALKHTKIDYMIILAHNFKDYIMQSLKGQYDGKFIIMFPDIKVI